MFLIVFVQATSLALKIETERVTGRKARGLQTGNRLQMSEIFFSLLSGGKKQTSVIFFPLVYTTLKRGFS